MTGGKAASDGSRRRAESARAHLRAGRWEEAAVEAEAGLDRFPEDIDLSYLAALADLARGRYGAALERLNAVAAAAPDRLDVLHERGIALACLGRYPEAAGVFRAVLREDALHADARRSLARVEPLAVLHRPRLTLAMIVKDEEARLPRALESVRDAVDEIVVVDTGSADRTVEIAEAAGARVFHHPWENDFAKHRNQSIDHATGDWILILDADEELTGTDVPLLRELIQRNETDAVYFRVRNVIPGGQGQGAYGDHYSVRLFRKRADVYYEGIVHNTLRLPERKLRTEMVVLHHGYAVTLEGRQRKLERSLPLLLRQLEERPDDPAVRFNTAQMYLSTGRADEAREHALALVGLVPADDPADSHLHAMGQYQLGRILLAEGRFEAALERFEAASACRPEYMDPAFYAGAALYRLGRWAEARAAFERFEEIREEESRAPTFTLLVQSQSGSGHLARRWAGTASLRLGELEAAEAWLNASIELEPEYWAAHADLGHVRRHRGRTLEAVTSYKRAVELGRRSIEREPWLWPPPVRAELMGAVKAAAECLQELSQSRDRAA
jgi:tetratricopeptide (TPR) repeat protein